MILIFIYTESFCRFLRQGIQRYNLLQHGICINTSDLCTLDGKTASIRRFCVPLKDIFDWLNLAYLFSCYNFCFRLAKAATFIKHISNSCGSCSQSYWH